METIDLFLAIILGINAMLFLGQAAILHLNPEATTFYSCAGTTIGSLSSNNCQGGQTYLNDTDPSSKFPSAEGSISPETGNIFTDWFTAAKNWLLQATGLHYLTDILGAPSNFMKALGADPDFAFIVGALWYALSLFVVITWARGG